VLRIIGEHCAEKGVTRDSGNAPLMKTRDNDGARSLAEEMAVTLFRKGASLAEVMDATARKPGTVADYLASFIAREPPASIDVWVPPDIQERVKMAAQKHGTAFLRPIFEELEQAVSYELIKIFLAFHAHQLAISVTETGKTQE